MKRLILKTLLVAAAIFCLNGIVRAQHENTELMNAINEVNRNFDALSHRLDVIEKSIDDLLWFDRVGDIAFIDKVYITGPPPAKESNPTGQGAGNPLKFWSYVFIPRDINPSAKYPLLVLPHGGVHANFTTYHTHMIREMVSQGYIVVAAEYRGSTGYGAGMYRRIDYGGLEVEDVDASRQYMIDNYEFVDKDRVGIIGWSHGGLIGLFCIFNHPEAYKACFAGVPVSDVVARMGYKNDGYRDLFSAPYHIGKTADQNVAEYRKRSPAWQADRYRNTPLLIHTNTNDEDVNVLEVEHLIKSLKAADKKNFSYRIFENMPGGHSFDRMDYREARKIRLEIYNFLNAELKPSKPFKNIRDLDRAGYRF
ncbi:MAG TPA: prolyl oligopeptidase family serine peptidase [Bacteroidales bacterium]|jgi:dipeptidyl aminopeptidase/acylaminoacyl peptidase|nr:prolyl oligopeptidase family serine peptidase [Bacteroidales bacterium]MDI9533791.1 prolyl oligopeptidase family serine peptidase [Bacteroidota bacterium]MBP8709236.1 prolyl oligopeptidase family serine peptidase [Bacteroidales bacterium]HNY56959.1 prolyl oligopeptidase family serine peptidase [Bacteroidales bacterium]HOC05403.1 prolyl oligopeptidase family serine peptidase [Bacteroidales bacterium]